MSDRLHVGIVGAGRVGIDWHLPDIRAAGERRTGFELLTLAA